MAAIHAERITTSFPYNMIDSNSDLGLPSLHRPHSLGKASIQSGLTGETSKREAKRNIKRSEPCFVTKRISYTLERAHWINAVQNDRHLKAKVVSCPLYL